MVGLFLFSILVLVCSLAIYKSSRLQICSSKQVFLKFGKFYREAPVLESLCNNVAASQVFSYEICKSFMSTFFTEHLQWLLLNLLKVYAC